jgi:hypothetical protein
MVYLSIGDKESAMAQHRQLLKIALSIKSEEPQTGGDTDLERLAEIARKSTLRMERESFISYAEMLLNKIKGDGGAGIYK